MTLRANFYDLPKDLPAPREDGACNHLEGIAKLFQAGPKKLPADEIEARKTWARKMLARARQGDTEGDYRRSWLLMALLEDYFVIRGDWYHGPKKALRWL